MENTNTQDTPNKADELIPSTKPDKEVRVPRVCDAGAFCEGCSVCFAQAEAAERMVR